MATKTAAAGEITIMEVSRMKMQFCVLGTTPMILHAMSAKVMQELLLPAGRKTAADKAANAKHDVIREFRDSAMRMRESDAETEIAIFPTSFKAAMLKAALDMPGAKKAQMGRLLFIHGQRLPVWGIPRVHMAITRSSDINHTPDVRTRAILDEWACKVEIEFQTPILREQAVANLLSAAGFQSGIGDWRQEKGSGNYGAFKLVSADDPDFVRITSTMGREAQIEAFDNPEPYDDSETQHLFAWYQTETARRGLKVAA